MFRLGMALGVAWLTSSAGFVALEAQVPQSGDFVVLSHSSVNLRAGPGLDAFIIGQSNKGTLFPLVGETGEWYEIQLFSGVPRYVSRSLCYHLTPDQIIPGHRLNLPSTRDSVAALTAAIAVEVDRAVRQAETRQPRVSDVEGREALRLRLVDRNLLELFTERGVQPAVYWLPEAEALRP
jgi:SH3-like domain-containing protein